MMLDQETLLKTLVGFDTTSTRSNLVLIDFIRNYLDDLGIETHLLPGQEEGKACLTATLGPRDRPGPMLAGHTDTVPVDGQDWTSDPFKLTDRNDKLYGRGSCDMKGFIACVLAALPQLDRKNLHAPIHLAFTHDEETNMAGAHNLAGYLKKNGIRPAWVWIGEPTALRLIDQHKGTAFFETLFRGIPGHSSKPDCGLNAIDCAVDYIQILKTVEAEARAKPHPHSKFDPPYSTFNTGKINGGTAENIIAEHCTVVWQVRTHPGDNLDAILLDIDTRATDTLKPRFAAFKPKADWYTCTCSRTPALSPVAENPGRDMLLRLTGRNDTEAVSFGTEGGIYQEVGSPVIICGPGSIDQAHKADEYVAREQLAACTELLTKTLFETTQRA